MLQRRRPPIAVALLAFVLTRAALADPVSAEDSPSLVPQSAGWPTEQGLALPRSDEGERFLGESADRFRIASSSRERPYWRRNLFLRVVEDQKFLVQSWWLPESRRSSFAFPLLGAVAAAGSSSDSDGIDELGWQHGIEGWTMGGRRDAAHALSLLGDTDSAILLVGTTYLASRWSGNLRMQRATSLSAEALANAALYSTLLKRISRRSRPSPTGSGEFFGQGLDSGESTDSFPSGHATGAFAVAAVLSGEFHERRWVPWVAYGTASLVAASRVGLGRHFPSDVVAGAVLGHSLGRMVLHRAGIGKNAQAWSRVEPLVDPESSGVGLAYRYSW